MVQMWNLGQAGAPILFTNICSILSSQSSSFLTQKENKGCKVGVEKFFSSLLLYANLASLFSSWGFSLPRTPLALNFKFSSAFSLPWRLELLQDLGYVSSCSLFTHVHQKTWYPTKSLLPRWIPPAFLPHWNDCNGQNQNVHLLIFTFAFLLIESLSCHQLTGLSIGPIRTVHIRESHACNAQPAHAMTASGSNTLLGVVCDTHISSRKLSLHSQEFAGVAYSEHQEKKTNLTWLCHIENFPSDSQGSSDVEKGLGVSLPYATVGMLPFLQFYFPQLKVGRASMG